MNQNGVRGKGLGNIMMRFLRLIFCAVCQCDHVHNFCLWTGWKGQSNLQFLLSQDVKTLELSVVDHKSVLSYLGHGEPTGPLLQQVK